MLFLHYRDYFAKVVTNLNVILKNLEGEMDKYSGIERFCKQISIYDEGVKYTQSRDSR